MEQQREANVARTSLQDGRVLIISNFVITQRHLHPDYICMPGPSFAVEPGVVTLVEVLQKDEGIPSFRARWDGSRAERRPLELDMAISGVPIGVMIKFRNNTDGYKTHHADKSLDINRRVYEMRLETPSGLIFDADISFSCTYEVAPHEHEAVSTALDRAVHRAETLTRTPDGAAAADARPSIRSPHAVAWLQAKLRSCLTYLNNRLL